MNRTAHRPNSWPDSCWSVQRQTRRPAVKVAKLNDRQRLFASPQAAGDTQRGAHAIANGIDLAGYADKAAATDAHLGALVRNGKVSVHDGISLP